MKDLGPTRPGDQKPQTAKRGRPRKKPNYNKEQYVQELIQRAVTLFGEPFDDRDERPPDAPTITSVAKAMNTTRIRVRKMLISAEYYSTDVSRKIESFVQEGYSISEICEKTGLGRAAVHSYLPYEKGAYNLDELNVNAELCRQFRKRKKACERLRIHLDDGFAYSYLWDAILAFELYPFEKDDHDRIKYIVGDNKIYCDGVIITREEIEAAYCSLREIQLTEGCVSPESFGRDNYHESLYYIFLRLGVCCRMIQIF